MHVLMFGILTWDRNAMHMDDAIMLWRIQCPVNNQLTVMSIDITESIATILLLYKYNRGWRRWWRWRVFCPSSRVLRIPNMSSRSPFMRKKREYPEATIMVASRICCTYEKKKNMMRRAHDDPTGINHHSGEVSESWLTLPRPPTSSSSSSMWLLLSDSSSKTLALQHPIRIVDTLVRMTWRNTEKKTIRPSCGTCRVVQQQSLLLLDIHLIYISIIYRRRSIALFLLQHQDTILDLLCPSYS